MGEFIYFIFLFFLYDLYFDTASGLFAPELYNTVQLMIAVIRCHALVCFIYHYSPMGCKLPSALYFTNSCSSRNSEGSGLNPTCPSVQQFCHHRTPKHKKRLSLSKFHKHAQKHVLSKCARFNRLVLKKNLRWFMRQKRKFRTTDDVVVQHSMVTYCLSIVTKSLNFFLPFILLISIIITKVHVFYTHPCVFPSSVDFHFFFCTLIYGVVGVLCLYHEWEALCSYILQIDCKALANNAVTILFLPGVFVLKLISFCLEPIYICILNINPSCKNILCHYIWQLRSRHLIFFLMLLSLLLFHSVVFIAGIDSHVSYLLPFLSEKAWHLPLSVLQCTIFLFVLILPYPFLVSGFICTVLVLGEALDTSSSTTSGSVYIGFPSLMYLLHALLWVYPAVQLLDHYHLDVFTYFFSKCEESPAKTSIPLCDMHGKLHIFECSVHASVKEFRSEITRKLHVPNECYWLSCAGKPLRDIEKLGSLCGTIHMHGRLLGGMECCIVGCSNAGTRKFDSLIGRYELKCSPDLLKANDITIFNDLKVCDKHYGSLSSRGHKPAKGKQSTKSRSYSQLGILKTNPVAVVCYHCENEVVLFYSIFCKRHNIDVFGNTFSVAYNFLDENIEGVNTLNSDCIRWLMCVQRKY